jgi:hypothetical protein
LELGFAEGCQKKEDEFVKRYPFHMPIITITQTAIPIVQYGQFERRSSEALPFQ